jgi:hypothetical protein
MMKTSGIKGCLPVSSIPRISKPLMLCPSGNPIAWMCTNRECKIAFNCGNEDCKYCEGKHDLCSSTMEKISLITKDLNQIAAQKNEVAEKIKALDHDFIETLTGYLQEFTVESISFNQEERTIFENLYNGKKGKNISGK